MAAMGGLLAMPLAAWERDGLKTALAKAGLPADDIGDPHLLFWRFESRANVPAGFGGLEIHHGDALLRSIVTLPPVRRLGMGSAIVAVLEIEARAQMPLDLSRHHLGSRFFRPPGLHRLFT